MKDAIIGEERLTTVLKACRDLKSIGRLESMCGSQLGRFPRNPVIDVGRTEIGKVKEFGLILVRDISVTEL
ncbi:MAG TPA: hypothetical protein VFL82_14375 [Thermomicrobiales bacterium]|nr:hypothetical protein [Thermomicrobiales bacterium]